MKLWEYKDYDEYVDIQVKYNKKKVGKWVFVSEFVIRELAKWHKKYSTQQPNNILCHGTRSGEEQRYFKKHFKDVWVLGTEISDNATNFPMTIQQDFNKVNESLIGKHDIIYSNSFDHSYAPKETLTVWKDQLNESGIMYIDWGIHQNNLGVCESDPLNATPEEIEKLAADVGLSHKENIRYHEHHQLMIFGRKENTK